MRAVACIKRVPDTTTKVRVGEDGVSIDRSGVEYVLNPYDEIAVEAAVKAKEDSGFEEAVALTLGPESATKELRTALAMGCDRAVHLVDDNYESRDSFAVASAIAEKLKELDPSVAFFGKQAIDTDNYQVPTMVARILGWASATVVISATIEGESVQCRRAIEGGTETITLPMPCVIGCQKGLHEPRYPALKGIMAAKRKPLEASPAPDAENRVVVTGMTLPPARPAGKKIEGEIPQAAAELVRLLREEAKII